MSNYMKLIGFKVYKDRDDDILEWWESIPMGERSQILRTLVRAFLNGEIMTTPKGEAATDYSRSIQLAQLQAETRWIRDVLMDMPGFFEDLFSDMQKVIRSRPVVAVADSSLEVSDNTLATETDAEKRAMHVADFDW